jgi:hypothetical protein
MDKTSLIIVPFLVISILMAGVLMTGFVPKIYETNEQVNTTNFLLQQRIALSEQQEHEDQARDIQAVKISTHVDNQLNRMQDNLTEFMFEAEKRSNLSFAQRTNMISNISIIVESLEQKSEDHAKFSKNMSELQFNVSNLSKEIRDMLQNYGDNSVQKFQNILDRQTEIINKLNNLSKIIT